MISPENRVQITAASLVGAFMAILLFSLAGTGDCEDAELALEHYCVMTENGHWPPYRDDIDCSGITRGFE